MTCVTCKFGKKKNILEIHTKKKKKMTTFVPLKHFKMFCKIEDN